MYCVIFVFMFFVCTKKQGQNPLFLASFFRGGIPLFFESSSFTRVNFFTKSKMSQLSTPPRLAPLPPSISYDTPPQIDQSNDHAFDLVLTSIEVNENQQADGGDSDVEGEECELMIEASNTSIHERMINDNDDYNVKESNHESIGFILSKRENELESVDEEALLQECIPKPPQEWIAPPKKTSDEPDFSEVDNPGNWNEYIFRPVFKGTGTDRKYVRHELPTGCSPVRKSLITEQRMSNGWELFYSGWKSSKDPFKARSNATPANIFPKERASSLNSSLLRRMGLNRNRMHDSMTGEPDALFFLQLLLPMCDPSRSGIESDPRKPYYHKVTRYSNLYKYQMGIGVDYGHMMTEASMPEFVRFDGCLVRDGVLGGGDGAIYRRWQKETPSWDSLTQSSISLDRFVQLKRILKLNDNSTSKKKGEEGYDPCYKYDMIYDTICSNVRSLTSHAELDLTGDETSWGHQGYGERGAGNLFRVVGKPGISKGGQTVLVSATNRIRPYWYQHRHKLNPKFDGMNQKGPCEVRSCIDALSRWVEGTPGNEEKIFREPPHITWDNFFSGENICKYAGEKGFGMTCTTRRDRLPRGIKGENLHKKKTDSSLRTKISRYVDPVVAVKDCGEYELVLVSFQSTSSCNIMSVNAVNEVKNFVELRSRGRNDRKRKYVIEQNFSRLVYLNNYSRIDSIDHLIKNCRIFYCCWKYWHSPKNHALALAICTAYDIYLECCEGHLSPQWKVNEPADFFQFRSSLSKQMLNYDPKNQLYPGDSMLRAVTKIPKAKRRKIMMNIDDVVVSHSVEHGNNNNKHVSKQMYTNVKQNSNRFCSISTIGTHLNSIISHKHPVKCAVCGKKTYKRCGVCGVSLHHLNAKGDGQGRNCFMQYHDEYHFGLCYADRSLVCKTASEWKTPTKTNMASNRQLIKKYSKKR